MGKLGYLLLELMTSLYWPLLPQMILESLWQNWRRRPSSLLRGLFLVDAWCFFLPAGSDWVGWDVEQLLAEYEIDMWGWGFTHGIFFFHVHRDDAWLAEQIMLAAGIPLT